MMIFIRQHLLVEARQIYGPKVNIFVRNASLQLYNNSG